MQHGSTPPQLKEIRSKPVLVRLGTYHISACVGLADVRADSSIVFAATWFGGKPNGDGSDRC